MKYKIIYADPPWSYNDTQKSGGTAYFGASVRYPTMNIKDILKLPINEIADKDCVLFMWATSPLLPEAIETIKAWGFKYKTVAFCWIKKTVNGKQVHNMGRWTMGGMELCLLGVKGHPQRKVKNIKQMFEAIRTKHSQKPFEVRKFIEDLMGELPRVELFARQKTQGWDTIGDGIDGQDIRKTLENMVK